MLSSPYHNCAIFGKYLYFYNSFYYNSGRKWYNVVKGGNHMFIGEYHHNLDGKGRIIIPVKFRELFSNKVIVSKGFDGCLNVYTLSKWQEVLESLAKLPNTKIESRQYKHMITAKATECELDNQGRILLPAPLITEALLEKACILVGAVDHVEIWAQERWESYYEQAQANFEEVAEKLTDFLI